MELPKWFKWSKPLPADLDEEHRMSLLEGHDDQHATIEKEKPDSTKLVARRSLRESLTLSWIPDRKQRELHPTSYLDGLRGVACFLVFIHHSSIAMFPNIRLGYGAQPLAKGAVNPNYPIQLPFVRVVFSGSAMVDIFFVISGVVLSLKPLRLGRDGEHQKLLENLSSSAFRRGPRLYIPCFVSTLVTALIAKSGLMLESGITRHYPVFGTWFEQFYHWLGDMLQYIRPNASGTGWEQNLWTIPIEFRGSLLVFLCCLGVAKLRSRWMRTFSLVSLLCFWFHGGNWDLFLFQGGLLISDLSLYRRQDPKHSIFVRGPLVLLLIFAVYLLSMPQKDENLAGSPYGYGWLHKNLSPSSWAGNLEPGRFWPCAGALLFVIVQTFAGPDSYAQRFFTTSFLQYLGEISYSFYLWHGLVIYTVGARVMTYGLTKFGSKGSGWWWSLALTELAMLPTLFLVAHISTRLVDRGAVKLSKKLMEL